MINGGFPHGGGDREAPSCHARWIGQSAGLDRKFSNEGRSMSFISP